MQKLTLLVYATTALGLLAAATWLGEPLLAWVLCDLLSSRIC